MGLYMGFGSFVAIVAIGIASNLDNAGVGMAYGVRNIKITFWPNMIIALISFAATCLSGYAGAVIAKLIPPLLANIFGTIAIISVGIWVLCQPWLERRNVAAKSADVPTTGNLMSRILRDPVVADSDGSMTISTKEAVILGLALAMNAFAGGFDAGMTKLNVLWTSVSVGICSFLLLGMATWIGRRFAAEAIGERATVAAGVLLILVGLHQML